jgi:hypothetical protein
MNNFEESLARLGDYESNKTRKLLIEIDDKLYSMNSDVIVDEKLEEDEVIDYYRGYDAISESVDDKEIKAWRKTFPYLQVFGQSLNFENDDREPQSNFEKSDNLIVEHAHSNHTENDLLSLVVCGTKMRILERTSDEEEEIFYSHGTLEETLEIDNSPCEETVLENIFLSIDPQQSHKAEVVNNLYDALIPDIIQTISPLVHRMVHLCRERGINYPETEEKSICSSEENDCFYSSGDEEGCFHQQEEEAAMISEW